MPSLMSLLGQSPRKDCQKPRPKSLALKIDVKSTRRPSTASGYPSAEATARPRKPHTHAMPIDNCDKTVRASRVFAYNSEGRRYTAGHCIETEIHAMNGSYPCPNGSRRCPAILHSESQVYTTRKVHKVLPGLPQGCQEVQSTVQRAWYRGDLNPWEARWDYTHDIDYIMPHVWDKCYDGYWAIKEDWRHHKDGWRVVRDDWKHKRQVWKQKFRYSKKTPEPLMQAGDDKWDDSESELDKAK